MSTNTSKMSTGEIPDDADAFVDPEEAELEGGLVDPRESINRNEDDALRHLALGAKRAMALLVEGMTPDSSGRTLLQLSKTAGHLHRITMLFDADEDFLLEGTPMLGRKIRRMRQMSRETAGVKMMQDVMATLGQIVGQKSMADDLRAVKAAKDAGMMDVAEALEARIRAHMSEPDAMEAVDTTALGKSVADLVGAHADAQEGYLADEDDYGIVCKTSNMYDGLGGLTIPTIDEDDAFSAAQVPF